MIVGNGGREHALAWKIAQSPKVTHVYVAPGNTGTEQEKKVSNVNISATDLNQLLDFAKKEKIDLTVIGPEAPLELGIVDLFQKNQLVCFGPTQKAAELESSKVFCKDFLIRHKIPTANYATFENFSQACEYIKKQTLPVVIKADGLAAGKGVVIAYTYEEAVNALKAMLCDGNLGKAGKKVVIEEFLMGEEASFIIMTDGKFILPLASSQDHKARDNGDVGPNTGGMGAYSPAPIVTPELQLRISKEIIEPTLRGMEAENLPYSGFLYAGVMISPAGDPKVLEFNCRLGDPETEPIMMRLETDLVELILAATEQKLSQAPANWSSQVALGLVLASQGYPFSYPQGEVIKGLEIQEGKNWKIFHAGTKKINNHVVTAGGRVLCITTLGDDVSQAQKLAYQIAKGIYWEHIYYRTDIGHRAIAREHQ